MQLAARRALDAQVDVRIVAGERLSVYGSDMPNPEAIGRVQTKHIMVLKRRLYYLEGIVSQQLSCDDGFVDFHDLAEIAALRVAVAELNEVYQARVDAGEIPQKEQMTS